MHHGFYTPHGETPNCPARTGEPRRAGELLPELLRRYVKHMAESGVQPVSLVDEDAAPTLGIVIVAVKSAGCAV